MSKIKALRRSVWTKVIAFLLALVFGVALCAGAGGLCGAAGSYYNARYCDSFEETELFWWRSLDKLDEVKEYLFLSLYSGSLTAEGRERQQELLLSLRQEETNFRFSIADKTGKSILSNGNVEELDETVRQNVWVYSKYQLGEEYNIGYYLDLASNSDWKAVQGTEYDWSRAEYTSSYYYTLEDFISMLRESADQDWLSWEELLTDADEKKIIVAAVDEAAEEEPYEDYYEDPATEEETYEDYDDDTITYKVYEEPASAEEDSESTEQFVYYQFDAGNEENYTVTYWLEPGLPVEDEFAYGAADFAQDKEVYETYFVPTVIFTAAALVLFLLTLALLTWTVGWNKENELSLRGLNRLPLEGLCVEVGAAVALAILVILLFKELYRGADVYSKVDLVEYYMLCFGAAGCAAVPLCLSAWMGLTAQLKTHQLLERSLLGRLWLKIWHWCKKTWRKIKGLVKNWPLYQKLVVGGCVYVLIYLVFLMANARNIYMYGNLISVGLLLIPVIPVAALFLKWAVDWTKLRGQVKKMIDGDLESKLDTVHMLPDLRDHGEDLNNLSAGLSKAVEERVKSQRFKTELITNVSHDLKTPLTSIINYVDLLKKVDIEDETVRGYIDVLDRKSQRLKTLTEDLVEASKAASGTIGVTLEPLDVMELVEQAVGEYDERLKQANLTAIMNQPEQPCKVMADGRHLWRILDNLLSNCTKYAMPGTRVYLDIGKKDGMCVIEVKNISADPLNVPEEELMKRFVRGDSARSTEGSGLGLSIARNLTIAQKGEFQLVVDGDLFKAVILLPAADDEKIHDTI